MTDNVYLNRDRTKVVSAKSADAKWQISRKEADALGLIDKPAPAQRTETTDTRLVADSAPKRKDTKKA